VNLLLLAVAPTELASGRYGVPWWAILVLGGLVVAGALVVLGVRFRRAPPPDRDRDPR
jgi:hypothetical protein